MTDPFSTIVSGTPTSSCLASEAAVHPLTPVLAEELSPRHITLNAVAPGPFALRTTAATLAAHGEQIAPSAPLGRTGRPSDPAAVPVLLASRSGAHVTGAVIPVDVGLVTPP